MSSQQEWSAAQLALGDLYYKFVGCKMILPEQDVMDFHVIWEDYEWQLSPGQKQMVALAELLYTGSSIRCDIGVLMMSVDDANWQTALEALTVRRGLKEGLDIPAGEWRPYVLR